jgi:hypothetical protein
MARCSGTPRAGGRCLPLTCGGFSIEAHESRTDHINHTEQTYQFVVEKLKAGCQVKVVLEGVRRLDQDACTVPCFALITQSMAMHTEKSLYICV